MLSVELNEEDEQWGQGPLPEILKSGLMEELRQTCGWVRCLVLFLNCLTLAKVPHVPK